MATIEAWYKREYVDTVLSDLKSEGYLTKGMGMLRSGVKADVVQWHKAGRLVANEMAPGIEVRPAAEQGFDIVEARMKAYECNADVNILDFQKMTIDQRREAQRATKNAIAETYDQVFVAALNDGAPTSGTGLIDGSARAIDVTDLLQAQTNLFGAGVKSGYTIYAAITYKMLAQLMLNKEIASADYNGGEPAYKKALGARSYLGINLVPFPDTLLPTAASGVKDGFMWIKDCLGQTSPTDEEGKISEGIDIHWDFMRKCWRINTTMMIGAKVLIPEGVQRLRFKVDGALARPA